MSALRSPNPGQAYRTPEGQPLLYVRTEQRPGCKQPEHLFVSTHNRVVFERWVTEVPERMDLILDTEGRSQANEQEWLRLVAEHERDLAFGLLKVACSWLPKSRADELRKRWGARQPPPRGDGA